MKWYWQAIIYLIVALVLINALTIYGFLKYKIWWEFQREWIEFTLNPIWQKAGIIEIQGGAETGKTLSIILLTQHLKGRKWSNVPNTINGWQYLKLPTLIKHRTGEFENGLVGVNNILLIDEVWNFFSSEKLARYGMSEDSLNELLSFMTETSKTGWKIFYVTKKGMELPESLKILKANNSAVIRTLGTRRFCEYWGRKYYFLDIEFITDPQKFDDAMQKEENNTKYAIENSDHRLKAVPAKPWWKKIFTLFTSEKQNIISIPFTQEELTIYDKTWNLDSEYAKNRMISVIDKLGADGLIEGLKYKQSRIQKLQEENEALEYYKKHPSKSQKEQMKIKGQQIAKQKGLWKSAEEQIEQEEKQLTSLLKQGKIPPLDYKEKKAKLVARKQKLAEAKSREQKAIEASQIIKEEEAEKQLGENQSEEPSEEIENNKEK